MVFLSSLPGLLALRMPQRCVRIPSASVSTLPKKRHPSGALGTRRLDAVRHRAFTVPQRLTNDDVFARCQAPPQTDRRCTPFADRHRHCAVVDKNGCARMARQDRDLTVSGERTSNHGSGKLIARNRCHRVVDDVDFGDHVAARELLRCVVPLRWRRWRRQPEPRVSGGRRLPPLRRRIAESIHVEDRAVPQPIDLHSFIVFVQRHAGSRWPGRRSSYVRRKRANDVGVRHRWRRRLSLIWPSLAKAVVRS